MVDVREFELRYRCASLVKVLSSTGMVPVSEFEYSCSWFKLDIVLSSAGMLPVNKLSPRDLRPHAPCGGKCERTSQVEPIQPPKTSIGSVCVSVSHSRRATYITQSERMLNSVGIVPVKRFEYSCSSVMLDKALSSAGLRTTRGKAA